MSVFETSPAVAAAALVSATLATATVSSVTLRHATTELPRYGSVGTLLAGFSPLIRQEQV